MDRYSPAHREYYIIEKFSKSEKTRHVVDDGFGARGVLGNDAFVEGVRGCAVA